MKPLSNEIYLSNISRTVDVSSVGLHKDCKSSMRNCRSCLLREKQKKIFVFKLIFYLFYWHICIASVLDGDVR